MKNSYIRHRGVVASKTAERMQVRIVQSSACSACKAASYCSASEQKEKLIDIYDPISISRHQEGDAVVVLASFSTGMKAVALGFGVPFLILIITLFVAMQLTHSESLAAMISILCLVPYFFAVWLLRDRLRDRFSFRIES